MSVVYTVKSSSSSLSLNSSSWDVDSSLSKSLPNTQSIISSFSMLSLVLYSSSRATSAMAVSFSAVVILEQFLHSHPSERRRLFLLQPHLPVVQPVTHLHPLNNSFTLSRTACRFSGVSQTTVSFSSVTVHPCCVMGCNVIVSLSACSHIWITQHDFCNKASVDGNISFSNLIRSHMF